MATKKSKEPLVRCNGTMTESAYLAWIRSALRSKSLRWKPRGTALEMARRAYNGPNKLQKWEYQCAICKEWFKAKECVVDHHPKPAGSILSIHDIGEFCNSLYCEIDNLRVLCKPDHDIHTLAEKSGITFEDARAAKKVIEITKLPTKQLLAWLAERGYNGDSVSNASKRKACVEKLLLKE